MRGLRRKDKNADALRLAVSRMGELVDVMHAEARDVLTGKDERAVHRLAADYISDQRRDLQRLIR